VNQSPREADQRPQEALETALRHAETGLALIDREALVTARIELDDAMALIGRIRPDRSERYARLIEQLSLLYSLLDEATHQDEPRPDLDAPVPDGDIAEFPDGLALPRLHIPVNHLIRTYVTHLTRHRRNDIQKAFHRAGRYLPFAKATFQAHGIPEELVNLAVIESAWNPHAVSPAQAVGIWQFIATTARRYGLAVTPRIDERRHPIKSTRAAARYLKDLHRQFKSWPLAIAAYNCGEDCVQRAIDRQRTRDVWALKLPDETRRYVPAVLAMTIIAADPERYGFTPPRS
jgi:membrane-bound lytic murein transglycosylase D